MLVRTQSVGQLLGLLVFRFCQLCSPLSLYPGMQALAPFEPFTLHRIRHRSCFTSHASHPIFPVSHANLVASPRLVPISQARTRLPGLYPLTRSAVSCGASSSPMPSQPAPPPPAPTAGGMPGWLGFWAIWVVALFIAQPETLHKLAGGFACFSGMVVLRMKYECRAIGHHLILTLPAGLLALLPPPMSRHGGRARTAELAVGPSGSGD